MKKTLLIAALAGLINTSSPVYAETFVVLTDDLGFYYAGSSLCNYANNNVFSLTVYLSNGDSYGELVGWGILFFSDEFNSVTLSVFETAMTYSYTMTGYWLGDYGHMLYCNTYGTSGDTYLRLLSVQ